MPHHDDPHAMNSTRNTRWTRWALIGAIAISILLLINRPGKPQNEQPQTRLADPVSAAPRRDSGSKAVHSEDGVGPDDAALDAVLGMATAGLNQRAKNVLGKAVACAQHIETQKDALASNEKRAGYAGHLESLERLLFLNDYAYAAQLSDSLNCGQGPTVFSNVLRAIRSTDTGKLRTVVDQAGGADLEVERPAAPLLSERYDTWVAGANPGYLNILTRLTDLGAVDPLRTDLLNDACLYVGMSTEIAEWQARDEREKNEIEAQIRASQVALGGDSVVSNGIGRSQRSLQTYYEPLGRVYREIFAFRLKLNHQLDGEAATAALLGLTLTDAGPELKIPCP